MDSAMDKGGTAVTVRGLHKSYRDVTAVGGIDLDIARGEVFALLGPNGAGKTTTVETHLLRAFGKLGVSGRTAAVTTAIERGLLAPPGANH